MRRLPRTMSIYEVERRVARIRMWLLWLVCGLWITAFATGMGAIWTGDLRWLMTGLLCFVGSLLPGLIYQVIKTPKMVPRMAEHYREHGVTIGGDEPS